MAPDTFTVALITEVFPEPETSRLDACLTEARQAGATLAVLPELPLNRWSPAQRVAAAEDAEPANGRRQQAMAAAARRAGIALLGGVILHEPANGRRFNTALLYAASGALLGCYHKLHLPQEEGFWEQDHYQPGNTPPAVLDGLAMPLGVQICSDANRPDGWQLLAAQGAELVVHPRATPPDSYARWQLVLRANAVTTSTYVISINRPRAELASPIGGPSLVIDPDGQVLLETTDPVRIVTLDRAVVRQARRDYPGYLSRRSQLWADAWAAVAGGSS